VRREGNTFSIDWPATVGFNQTGLKVLRASPPPGEVTLRVTAEISDLYIHDYMSANTTHYSFRLKDDVTSIHRYVEKETPLGKQLYQIVKDSKSHELTVKVRWPGAEGSVADIIELVRQDWYVP